MKLRNRMREIKTSMDVRFLLILLFTLVSCMPESQVSRGNLSNTQEGTTSGSGNGGSQTPPATATNLSWNYLGNNTSSIIVYASNLNLAYLIGTPVENYLNTVSNGALINFTGADYCLVSDYSLAGVSYQLRTRVVPISYYDFTNRRTVRVFRVDFNDITNSASVCNATLKIKDVNGVDQTDPLTPATHHYDPRLICPNCTSMLTAVRVRLFKRSGDLFEIPVTTLRMSTLGLQLDPNNNVSGGATSCSNAECISRGFSCCLDNQCVREGSTRPAAITQYYSQWQLAEEERKLNSFAYLNYPHIYYVCGIVTTPPGNTTTGGSGGGSYDAAFEQLVKDYNCVEHIKAQTTTKPFHNELLSRSSFTAANECLTASNQSSQLMHYTNVMKRLYTTCGCARTELTDMISSCPAYEYTVVLRDANNRPTKIDCYTPPASQPIPRQRSVSVNSRTAPHRFFDSNGIERDITSGSTASFSQEGDQFSYLDSGKVLPNQTTFSMNAILGPMSVALDQALPARTVEVELDQVYLISTTSGFYTPCPMCGKDSWLSAFTAWPSSASGVGLQAVGFTTQRDSLSTNNTQGNYEDTIFGRACWIPPTMIPYSHLAYNEGSEETTKLQRENRLRTQAALFVNGYQRDWYGFNKGALIGSFDGVTWFAIGKGRIVKSTSKKLFLAINAPFADVASPTLHVVNVQAYDGITQAAQVDYDPRYHLSHPFQNEAGNCQANHMCSTDTECVTRLGWEYMCADVKDIQTQWPVFDTDAKERGNKSTVIPLYQITQQKSFPSASTRRCVYRGAGAVCHANSSIITDLNTRKTLTCAPNFHCANLTNTSYFNSRVARFAAKLEDIPVTRNHFYGKDANVLGRPLNYMGDTSSFPGNSRNAVVASLREYEPTSSVHAGLCMPGKALPVASNQLTMFNPYAQHQAPDGSRRADYINQIGSCNSTLFSDYRHSSCPVIGSDGNYEMFADSIIASGYHLRARTQNACGLESLHSSAVISGGPSADTLQQSSPFRMIEGRPLHSQIIVEPTLVRDACLRRAGQVCHTDLDCSPNKFHGDQIDSFNLSFFGNEAERSYYRETLICGQMNPQPKLSDQDGMKAYDMKINRCCREVGKDITTFTSDTPKGTASNDYEPTSQGLKVTQAPGIAPNDPKRYSRLAVVENLGTVGRPALTANYNRGPTGFLNSESNITTPNQWLTLRDANSKTCCGGGWIRKFADGSTDWTKRDRFYLDVTSFRCLNSRSVLLTNPAAVASQYVPATASTPPTAAELIIGSTTVTNYVSLDRGDYCKDGVNVKGSCAQYSFTDSTADILPSFDPYTAFTVNTVSPSYSSGNLDYYFTPRSADINPAVFIDYGSNTSGSRRNIQIRIPSYITRVDFDNVYLTDPTNLTIQMVTEDGNLSYTCTNTPALDAINSPVDNGSAHCTTGGTCCYSFNSGSRILKVVANSIVGFNNKKVGVKFSVPVAGQGIIPRFKPGSNSYYLRRLGRLELSGIPQVTYEPLYCSDNYNNLVPGIFKPNVKTAVDFNNPNFSFSPTFSPFPGCIASGFSTNNVNNCCSRQGLPENTNSTSFTCIQPRMTTHHGLQSEPVFSANEFKCCVPLGRTTSNTNNCCSGYGLTQDETNTKFTCALPAGTNLMVYFNRFVSNEGISSDHGAGLVDTDFNALTGEPLLIASVNDKIRELGTKFCESGRVRQGGAFGLFEPEPQGNDTDLTSRLFNIVDSSRDIGQNSNAGRTVSTGYNAFMDGFRWNHHLYCND